MSMIARYGDGSWESQIKGYKLTNQKIKKSTLKYIKFLISGIMKQDFGPNYYVLDGGNGQKLVELAGWDVFSEYTTPEQAAIIKEKLGYNYDMLEYINFEHRFYDPGKRMVVDMETVINFVKSLGVEIHQHPETQAYIFDIVEAKEKMTQIELAKSNKTM